MRNYIALLLCFLLLLAAVPLQVSAYETEGDFIYEVYNEQASLLQYNGSDKVVEVPGELGGYPVIRIETYAFRESAVEEVILPESLETVGDYAFYNSELGGRVIFPTSLKKIAGYAFRACDLTSVIFGSKLESIGIYAFTANPIETLFFNQNHSLKTIGYNAFDGNRLTALTLPDSLTSIGGCAFRSSIDQITVYCPSVTPPTLEACSITHSVDSCGLHSCTSGSYTNKRTVNLYVPADSVAAYKSATGWRLSATVNPYNFN